MNDENPFARYEKARPRRLRPVNYYPPMLPDGKKQMGPAAPLMARDAKVLMAMEPISPLDMARLGQLEQRLGVSEKSQSILIEDMRAVQGELLAQLRLQGQALQQEQMARQQLQVLLQGTGDELSKLNARMLAGENRLSEDKTQMAALVNHTKGVEQAVLNSQQELLSRRDLHTNQLHELKAELEESRRGNQTLERSLAQLNEELRQVKGRLTAQGIEFQQAAMDLKNKSTRLEDENRQVIEAVRLQSISQNQSDQAAGQIRQQMEGKMAELHNAVVDLRNKHDVLTAERGTVAQEVAKQLADLQEAMADQNAKREESQLELERIMMQREQVAEVERARVQSRIADITDFLENKMPARDQKLKEDFYNRLAKFEQAIEQDREARFEAYQQQKQQMVGMDEQIKLCLSKNNKLQDQHRTDVQKLKDSLHKMNDGVKLVEKQLDQHMKQQDTLLAKEVEARKAKEKVSSQRLDEIEMKLNAVSTAPIFEGKGHKNTGSQSEQLDVVGHAKSQPSMIITLTGEEEQEMMEKPRDSLTSDEVDVRIEAVRKISSSEVSELDAKISGNYFMTSAKSIPMFASAVIAEALVDKVEALLAWQEAAQQKLQYLEGVQAELQELQQAVKTMNGEQAARINNEAESRIQDIANLKKTLNMQKQASSPPLHQNNVSQEELEEMRASIQKLALSIQTTKTMLGMKIQSEQKLRKESVKGVQEEIDDVWHSIAPGETPEPSPKPYSGRRSSDRVRRT